jgi:hypothetical protein
VWFISYDLKLIDEITILPLMSIFTDSTGLRFN